MIELLYAVVYVWAIGATFWAGSQVKSFLAATPAIGNHAALERYKELARRNMYLALIQIAVLVAGLILGVVLIFRHGVVGFVAVLVANALLFVVSKQNIGFEKQARALSAATEELAREHRRISDTWVKKPLPDF